MQKGENINDILAGLQKNGIDETKIKGGNVDDIIAALSPEQQSKLNSILNDKAKTEKILSSPVAQQLIKQLLGGNNG
ncbi:MAG: hypothetical protein E7526_07585 [Ruminococcaceae bacterium]|nr:hypothetical protein [Oscillospiraceae bacterium]